MECWYQPLSDNTRMEEDQLVKRIMRSNVRGVRLRGRPRDGRMIVRDGSKWRAVVNA